MLTDNVAVLRQRASIGSEKKRVDISMYADGLGVSRSHRDIDTATAKVQATLDE